MRLLTRAAAVLAAAVLAAAGAVAIPAGSAPASPASGGCTFVPPNTWVCVNQGRSPGGPGSGGGGGHVKVTCTLTRLGKAEAVFLGLQWPPPKGDSWDAITCPGAQPFGGVTLVNNKTGAPAITPQQLLQIAIGELFVPAFTPSTAPPRGKDGLVGLPEWFWIPRGDWKPVSVTVTAGPVSATATAAPVKLTFTPGPGLAPLTCAGPGTPYNPARPASAQHTNCSYTYDQSSALQPGGAYPASVTVTWRVSWTGTGGAGGVVNAALQVPAPFNVRVAEGQALVTGGN